MSRDVEIIGINCCNETFAGRSFAEYYRIFTVTDFPNYPLTIHAFPRTNIPLQRAGRSAGWHFIV